VSVHPFHPPTRRGGIKMRVQMTTFADTDHIISFGGQGRRPNQLDSSFGIDTTLPTNGELPWERRPSKEGEFTRDSLDERPFTSKSYAEDHKSCVYIRRTGKPGHLRVRRHDLDPTSRQAPLELEAENKGLDETRNPYPPSRDQQEESITFGCS
ncbi:hypothetical protein FRC19_006426, partial [Serendipita sp. 401]